MAKNEKKPLVHLGKSKATNDPHDYGLSDLKIDPENYKNSVRIEIVRYEGNDLEFDIIGIHPAILNSVRRIILSEVPSMAIEKVFIFNNTSVIQDEVLAHRLGLIPLKADARLFDYRTKDTEELGTELDTLEFELKVKCTRKKDAKDNSNPEICLKNNRIYSNQIKWLPRGKQAQIYKDTDVSVIHDDILITQLRPGHEIDLRFSAVKGVGKDHAKFSPVATAYYRLLPVIKLNYSVYGKDAILLQKCFSPGVIGIDESDFAFVKDARYDACSRNALRFPEIEKAVTMSRVRDHFIFTIESIGALKPDIIFLEALKILKKKCRLFIDEIDET